MSFEINVNSDATINYVSRFRKGRDSLAAMGARALVEMLNKLDRAELWAVILAVKTAPFPMGSGVKVYKRALEVARNQLAAAPADMDPLTSMVSMENVGELRKAMCLRYCGGWNAPGDSYIRIAIKVQDGTAIEDEY